MPWLSSTMTMASYRSARSQMSGSFGQVAVHGEDAVGGDQLQAAPASSSFASRSAMSLCL